MKILLVMLSLIALSAAADEEGGYPTMLQRTLQHEGIEREYFVHIPQWAIVDGGGLPLVLAIHGYTSTATGFQLAHGLNRHADQHGYAVVYPQGSHFLAPLTDGESFRVTSWNDLAANMPETPAGPHCSADSAKYPCPAECGECTRCAWTGCYDDVGFLDKVLDAVIAGFPIDANRVYVLGVSNGAMMTLRLGCNLSARFAAIAPIIGQLAPGYACGPTADLPMLHLFGGKDETVRFDGTPGKDDGFRYTSAAETASTWAASLACKTGPKPWQNAISKEAGLDCSAWSDCRVGGQEVVGCMEPGGEHWWPQQGFRDFPATCVTAEQYESIPGQPHCGPQQGEYEHLGMDLIWNFFGRYRRSSRTQ